MPDSDRGHGKAPFAALAKPPTVQKQLTNARLGLAAQILNEDRRDSGTIKPYLALTNLPVDDAEAQKLRPGSARVSVAGTRGAGAKTGGTNSSETARPSTKRSAWLWDGVVPAYSRNSRGEERDVWEEEFEPPI